MTYSNWEVNNLLLIPNYFFTPAIIEKRGGLDILGDKILVID